MSTIWNGILLYHLLKLLKNETLYKNALQRNKETFPSDVKVWKTSKNEQNTLFRMHIHEIWIEMSTLM